jgi:hypothetical protein
VVLLLLLLLLVLLMLLRGLKEQQRLLLRWSPEHELLSPTNVRLSQSMSTLLN